MKKMKKLASLVLALAMALTLAVPAMAYNITIEGTPTSPTADHTYKVYQIFTGELVQKTDEQNETINVLSNIKYGANYHPDKEDGTAVNVGDKVPQADINAITNARAFADNLVKNNLLEGTAIATLKEENDWTATGLEAGYYLIQDVTTSLPEGEGRSAYIVQVVDNVNMAPKSGIVDFEKKVKDINDSVADKDTGNAEYTEWQDSADHDIGDSIPFQLKGTLPADYASYDDYYFAFHDKESAGLEFDASTVKVYVGNQLIDDSNYRLVQECEDQNCTFGNACTFSVIFDNMKDIAAAAAGSVITVEYESVLTEDAVIGSAGNPNEAYLEYSNEPDSDGKGKTEKDKVIVFTYKVIVNKVDENKNPLAGAEFTLYKKNAKGVYVQIGSPVTPTVPEEGNVANLFGWKGLDDGDYKLVESKTPAGYNTMADLEFTISAEHDTDDQNPTLISLSGGNLGTGEVSTGAITKDIKNQSGATLPETGGMGTTLFYALGAVLVIGAGVAMVTKKRMA